MCPEDLERKIRPDTRAVVLTHLGGMISPAWRRIARAAERAGAVLIEDAAHAHGAEVEGLKAGALGLAGAFSFYPTKVLTTAEGGMATTSDAALAERMRSVRQHGQSRPGSNVHEGFGLNFRPSEIHALLGLRMMAKAEWILSARRAAAAVYDRLLAGSEAAPVLAPPGQRPAYYKYMALLPEGADRAEVKRIMREDYGVALAGEVYATPAHRQPIWAARPGYLAAPPGEMPASEMVARRQICLPLWPGLAPADQELVADALARTLGRL
jgi:dTDP-4-amino-4,6-dideoxygalactose transaminase